MQRQLFDGTAAIHTLSRNCVVCLESVMMLSAHVYMECACGEGQLEFLCFCHIHKFLQEMYSNKNFNQIYSLYVASEHAKNIFTL